MDALLEEYLTPEQLSIKTNGSVSQQFIRDACNRSIHFHRLPHIRIGNGRKVKVRLSTFESWLEEEERL